MHLNVSVCFGHFHKWLRKFCYSFLFMLIRPVLLTLLSFEYSFEVCLLESKQTNIKLDRRHERGLFSYSLAAFAGQQNKPYLYIGNSCLKKVPLV